VSAKIGRGDLSVRSTSRAATGRPPPGSPAFAAVSGLVLLGPLVVRLLIAR
jgi:hypothetical protein